MLVFVHKPVHAKLYIRHVQNKNPSYCVVYVSLEVSVLKHMKSFKFFAITKPTFSLHFERNRDLHLTSSPMRKSVLKRPLWTLSRCLCCSWQLYRSTACKRWPTCCSLRPPCCTAGWGRWAPQPAQQGRLPCDTSQLCTHLCWLPQVKQGRCSR